MIAAEQLHVARGLTLPVPLMRAVQHKPLVTQAHVRQVLQEVENDRWLAQPNLNGERACLAIVDRKVYIHNDRGIWISRPPGNVQDFLKLPDGTCLDGKISNGDFHPFECLAIRGRALVFKPVAEREAVALHLVRFLHHRWMYARPTQQFIRSRRENLPQFKGITLKDYMGFYLAASKKATNAPTWIEHSW